ncbi:DOT1-domain-containing protein [Testicularia cyperi]|uniref:Histone-lysine N-methyltransferase, H3 lysine-79 specific n=1 Tax=Testicularia cyperi TaxID=1882483 RepID=A0A317XM22_9BASI|nr:DOT1-domain-containing protein [Testicularia cyperi]
MINFFGKSAKPSTTTASSTTSSSTTNKPVGTPFGRSGDGAASLSTTPTNGVPPKKKQKVARPPPVVTVTTTKKAVTPKPKPEPKDPIAALSGFGAKNALPEEKRRRIIEERLAAQRQKSIETSLENQLRAPVKSPKKNKSGASNTSARSKKGGAAAKRNTFSDSSDDDEDDYFGGGSSSRKGSRAPSTPRGSKRGSVDPHPISDSYQRRGREGVLPNYVVPRDILAAEPAVPATGPMVETDASAVDSPLSSLSDLSPSSSSNGAARPISSADIVGSNIKAFGPYFHGLGDAPRCVLEYPGKDASEEYLLMVPKDADEYDPLMELLATVRAIATHYLTSEQLKAFGSLDGLEVSGNAGMVLATASAASTTTNGNTAAVLAAADGERSGQVNGHYVNGSARAKSADLLDIARTNMRDAENDPRPASGAATSARTPEPDTNGMQHAHTAPVSPSSHGLHGSQQSKSLGASRRPPMLSAALRLDSPVPAPSPLLPTSSQGTDASSTSADPDPILRSFTKARNRRDGPLFMRTLARFNAALKHLKDTGAIEANIGALGSRTGVPEGIWRLVQDQVYARCVGPRVEELGRYQAFSDNVYGELLPRFMSEIAQLTNLGPGKTFIDLGSGVGNLLIQTSLQTGADCFGCEIMPIPASLATKQVHEAQARWKLWGVKGGTRIEAWKGDFGEHPGVRDTLKHSDVVLVNNYAFLPTTNENLSLLFLDLPDNSYIVSLKPFVPPDFRLTERTLSSPLAILRTEERTFTSNCVSWAAEGGKYYIQKVDRSLVRDFLANKSGTNKLAGDVRRKRWKRIVDEDDEDDD